MSASVRRVDILAQPKPIPPGFIEDRVSVYWIDRWPPEPGDDGITIQCCSERLEDLAHHKCIPPQWFPDRPNAYRPVSEAAKRYIISDRLSFIAAPRQLPENFKLMRSPYTTVTKAAKCIEPTERLIDLCKPKPHKIWTDTEPDTYPIGDFSESIRPVSLPALRTTCSSRLNLIATPKATNNKYKQERPVRWPIPQLCRTTEASSRLCELSTPKAGRLRRDLYDPYKVSYAAKRAIPTNRICELAIPVPRKVRAKKA